MRAARRQHRQRQRGQALIETAIVVIFAMTLFMGVYGVATAIGDRQIASEAVRSGARYAAQVGDNGYAQGVPASGCQGSDATDPCAVDQQVLQNVLSITTGFRYTDTMSVTIYEPCSDRGSSQPCSQNSASQCINGVYVNGAQYDSANDPGEVYTLQSGTWTRAASPLGLYDLSKRLASHPTEAAVGVQVNVHYKAPTPFVRVDINMTEYTVNCLAPKS